MKHLLLIALTGIVLACALLLWPFSTARAADVLVEFGSTNKYLVNYNNPLIGGSWTASSYPPESGWTNGTYGIGYDTGSGALNLLDTQVSSGPSGGRRRRLSFQISNSYPNHQITSFETGRKIAYLQGVSH